MDKINHLSIIVEIESIGHKSCKNELAYYGTLLF